MNSVTEEPGMLEPDQLRPIDERLLDFLQDGRVTPAYVRKKLKMLFEDEYSRGYVQQRLARLEEHSHVENLLDTGLYQLRSDPRSDDDE